MKSVNKVILVGNVGQDPETRYLPNGSAVTTLSLATSEEWKDKTTGEKQERTEWHRVVFFGRSAEIAGEYIRKGRKIYIEGKNRTRKWQAQDGSDRWTTEVLADDFLLLGGGEGRQDPQGVGVDDYARQASEAATRAMAGEARPSAPRPPAGADFEDDIPFMRLQNEYTV